MSRRRKQVGKRPASHGKARKLSRKDKGVKLGEKVINYSKGYMECDSEALLSLLLKGHVQEFCRLVVNALIFHEVNTFNTVSPHCVLHISNFVAAVFAAMTMEGFCIPGDQAGNLIVRSHIFANLVALTNYKTTDAVLKHAMGFKGNYFKVLFLNTSRNKTRLDAKELYDASPALASLWAQAYQLPTVGAVQKYVQENLQYHFEQFDDRYVVTSHLVSSMYFNVTYFAPSEEKRVKTIINRACTKRLGDTEEYSTKPSRSSIAIVTSKWFSSSAVYKSCAPAINNLRDRGYKLTLVHTGRFEASELAREDFDNVIHIKAEAGEINFENLEGNDFGLAYYPDVGMTDESVWLANLRIAPIQATTYGHPVSTWCSEMDYFLIGEEAERIEDVTKNYSETTIVLPGTGVVPADPTVPRKYPKKREDKVIVNCPWGPDKNIYSRLFALKVIWDQCELAKGPMPEFHLFPSPAVNRYNAVIPFKAEIAELLGDTAVVHTNLNHEAYMEALEDGHLTLNSYPFGGYNTVVESLHMGVPVITQEGNKFYNIVASPLLKSVGLEDLVTPNLAMFIGTTVRLISQPEKLQKYTQILESADLKVIFNQDITPDFERAIETIIGGPNGTI